MDYKYIEQLLERYWEAATTAEEERILRVRHDDETESIYGNLLTCYAQEGDRVYAGDVTATTIEGKPLVFELRRDGRSIDPEGLLKPIPE